MTIRGLNSVFKTSFKTLKTMGFKNGTKDIFNGVRKEGGRTSTLFCGIGFVAGCIAPLALLSAPALGYTGAILGKVLSNTVKAGIKYSKKGLNCLV